jgi:NCS1 family nucleobase:cation symporter-1
LPGAHARTWTCLALTAAALAAALLSKDTFLANYEEFILLLLYVLVPWTAINLVDYYLLRHGEYDVSAFLRQDGGMYGRVNLPATTCYVFGILLQLPFVSSTLYTGPIAKALGGIDLSWIVGLVVTSPLYYWLGKRSQSRRGLDLAPTAQLPT